MEHGAQPGQLVGGRYRLLRALGAGGMGRVWEAHDEQLDARVAVKELALSTVMSPQERAERLERAIREARNAARLRDHPGIVTVHDVVIVDGVPWIVMQLVSGTTVQDRLREQGRLSVELTAEVGRAVLEALRAAHAEGIVHRDIKPGNVMLASDGRVLLADFGIAVNEADVGLTGTGVVIGSAPYLCPERAVGEPNGAPGDLFSLGVTLYEAVEGVSPFQRGTVAGSLFAVVHEPAPPMRYAGRLAPLISGLLAKDPAARLTVARALALLDAAPSEPVAKPPMPPLAPVPPPPRTEAALPPTGAPAPVSQPGGAPGDTAAVGPTTGPGAPAARRERAGSRPDRRVAVVVPAMGEGVTEVRVGTWLRQVGDPVRRGQTLLTVSAGGAVADVPSPVTGVLHSVGAVRGTVRVGGILGVVFAGDPPRDDEDEETRPERSTVRRGRLRRAVTAVVGVAVLASLVGAAYGWTRTQYYVGARDGHVALYRGIDQRLGWIPLSEVQEDHPEIDLGLLPAYQRLQVQNTIGKESPEEARAVIRQLATQAQVCRKYEAQQQARSDAPPAPALSAEEQALVSLCDARAGS